MVVRADIFFKLRAWAAKRTKLLTCSLCAGFWVAFLNGIWLYVIYMSHLPHIFLIVNIALCGSIFSYTYDMFIFRREIAAPRMVPPPFIKNPATHPSKIEPCVDCPGAKKEEAPLSPEEKVEEIPPGGFRKESDVIKQSIPTIGFSSPIETFSGGKFGK